jgi:prolyl-tRNA synthetase
MKDSYTLDATWEGLNTAYELHAEAYKKIFTRAGLNFFIVGASSGAMGGSASQEFMIESDAGEDTCAICDKCGYAANLEVASSNMPKAVRSEENLPMEEIATPNVGTIDELKEFLKVGEKYLAKSLVYIKDKAPILVLMMGNDQLNESKLLSVMGEGVRPTHQDELVTLTGANAGSIGPVGLKGFTIIADKRLEGANNLISGANKNDFHIKNIDLKRDTTISGYHDLRMVENGEPCPKCNTPLRIVKAIELGHIFKLGTKYSDALHAYYLDEKGKEKPIVMGSYGIGVERIIACHIEQNHDKYGIIWGKSIAPYHVHLMCVNANNEKVLSTAEHLYTKLQESLIDVLYDDRNDVTPGFKFKDADLLGMPLQIIVGEKNITSGKVEFKERKSGKRELVEVGKVVQFVEKYIES